ncbi:MAG: restriction endonuclease subunit S [Treponema sp.]|nr:restriction endonuclease subunit S [Treponema sp.]
MFLFLVNPQHSSRQIGAYKKLNPISDEELPFETPDNWVWCRLSELGNFVRGNGIKRSETVPKVFPCVRYGEMYTTYKTKFSETNSFTTKDIFDKCQKAKNNDIFMALTGENKWDIALAAVYQGNDNIAIGGDLCKFTPIEVNSLFLVYVINSPYGIESKRKVATGDIIVHISADKLGNLLIPLPPLDEQHRIVQQIEKMLSVLEASGL